MPENPTAPTREGFATPAEALASLAPLHDKIAQVASKTPSTVIDAYLPEPLAIGALELPPIRMRTWLYLEKINSPFVQGVKDSSEITMEDLIRTLYVITQPADRVRHAIRAGEAALAGAVDAFADTLPVHLLPELTAKLAAHLQAEFSPQAQFAREEEGSGSGPKASRSSATEPGAG